METEATEVKGKPYRVELIGVTDMKFKVDLNKDGQLIAIVTYTGKVTPDNIRELAIIKAASGACAVDATFETKQMTLGEIEKAEVDPATTEKSEEIE